MNYRTIPSKTILSKLKNGVDSYFGTAYSMNIYRGCQHQCIYCDSRSECYQLGDLADIRVKENVLSTLEKELKSKRSKLTIGTGSMNDPYMPVEKELELVRNALKLVASYRFPIHIITKSDLVIRDIDIIKEIAKVYAAVSFTITTSNDEMAKVIEPAAPSSSKRFEAMRQLSENGIYTGVTLMPILPFINDTWAEIESIIVKAKESGAKYLLFWAGLTLRAGSREYFYDKLDMKFSGVKDRYISQFGENYICDSPNAKLLYSEAQKLCNKLALPMKMNFFESKKDEQLSLF